MMTWKDYLIVLWPIIFAIFIFLFFGIVFNDLAAYVAISSWCVLMYIWIIYDKRKRNKR